MRFLVRLQAEVIIKVAKWDKFQFQSGAITSMKVRLLKPKDVKFQFQSGAITSQKVPKRSIRRLCFNSNLVRLQDVYRRQYRICRHCFNSNLVRLQENQMALKTRYYHVSIPIWCDYKYVVFLHFHCNSLFQFQSGAITSLRQCRDRAPFREFQFQSGAITSDEGGNEDWLYFEFQFQSGAITRMAQSFCSVLSIEFQFQSGAITSFAKYSRCECGVLFQFQSGAITRQRSPLSSNRRTCFNSNLVRLQAFSTDIKNSPVSVSIPIWCDYKTGNRVLPTVFLKFQFQSGAITSRLRFEIGQYVCPVSIPIWCDYKNFIGHDRNSGYRVSIPIWCDYKWPGLSSLRPSISGFNSNLVRLQEDFDFR